MLANFFPTGKLQKIAMADIEMMSTPNYTIGLDERTK